MDLYGTSMLYFNGKLAFWIQIHNVPLPFMTKVVVEAIKHQLGKLFLVDSDKGRCCWGKFLRIHV